MKALAKWYEMKHITIVKTQWLLEYCRKHCMSVNASGNYNFCSKEAVQVH